MKYTYLLIGLLFLVPTKSHAVSYELQKNEFGFDGGQANAVSDSDFDGLIDNIGVVGAHYTRFITPRFGIGAQVDYLSEDRSSTFDEWSYDPTFQITTFDSLSVRSDFEDLSVMATGRVNLWTRGIVVPYVSAGFGLNRFSIKTTASTYGYISMPDPMNPGSYLFTSASASASETDSSVNVCGMIGLGADVMISEVFRIGTEGRYNYYKQSALKDVDDIEMFMLKGKISWFF